MLFVFPQDSKVYFDDALLKYLLPYEKQSNDALMSNDFDRAEFLFDSLVKYHLKGTYIPNLKLNEVSGKVVETDSLKLPFLLITKPSWFNQDEEIDAINLMASEYKDQILIIVLYWDTLKKVKKLEKKYNKNIILTYIDEIQNKSGALVKTYKHSFGAPVCFFISHQKQLESISKRFELSKQMMENTLISSSDTYKHVTLLLFEHENSSKGAITTLDNDEDAPDH